MNSLHNESQKAVITDRRKNTPVTDWQQVDIERLSNHLLKQFQQNHLSRLSALTDCAPARVPLAQSPKNSGAHLC